MSPVCRIRTVPAWSRPESGRDELLDVGMQALQDTCRRSSRGIDQARRNAGGVGLFAAHVNVEGSIASNGQPSIGKELSITTDDVADVR